MLTSKMNIMNIIIYKTVREISGASSKILFLLFIVLFCFFVFVFVLNKITFLKASGHSVTLRFFRQQKCRCRCWEG